jgi:hypothetical protein
MADGGEGMGSGGFSKERLDRMHDVMATHVEVGKWLSGLVFTGWDRFVAAADPPPGNRPSCGGGGSAEVHMTGRHAVVVQAAERSATGRRRRLTLEMAGGV